MAEKLDKDILVHQIAELIIELAKIFHISGKDPVGELYNTNLAVSQHIGLELEVIRMRERGEIA